MKVSGGGGGREGVGEDTCGLAGGCGVGVAKSLDLSAERAENDFPRKPEGEAIGREGVPVSIA